MSVHKLPATETKPAADTGEGLSVYYHTHWDREWYLPFRAFQVRLAEVVDEMLERLETGALPCFMLDGQTVVLEDYLELRPENRDRLKTLIDAGKLSIGPWYVAPDEFLVSGESLIRNLQRGIRQARAWGCTQFTGYLPDTFGHSADMPTIFQGFGIDSAIVWRGLNPKNSILNWQSPSGATVKTLHLTDGYFQMMLDDWTLTPEHRLEALDNLVRKIRAASPPSSKEKIGLLPMGADHMGPLPGEAREILMARYPKLNETTPEKFMAALPELSDLETVTGELMDNSAAFLLPGVWSSRMYLKQANRRLEHLLTRKLEPLLAMTQAFLPPGSFRYPTHELDLAWKLLLLNHPHDSICGCSVDEVHRENMSRFEQVEQIADALKVRAEHALSALGSEDEWVIFNAGDTPYTGIVHAVEKLPDHDAPASVQQKPSGQIELQDAYLFDPHRIPLSHLTHLKRQTSIWVENIPAKGYKIIPKTEGVKPGLSSASNALEHLENEYLSVLIGNDGKVTVTDKHSGNVYEDLLKIRAITDAGDSYNSDPVPEYPILKATFFGPFPAGDDSESLSAGRLLLYRFTDPKNPKSENYRDCLACVYLMTGRPYLGISFMDIPKDLKVQACFSTGQPIKNVMAETHFYRAQRDYNPDYREQDQSPAGSFKELKSNTGPIQRFISANNQTIITEGLTEYEISQKEICITLTRPFGKLSKKQLRTRGAPAGPPLSLKEATSFPTIALGRPLQNELQKDLNLAWMPTPETPAQLYEAAGRFYGNVGAISGTGTQKTAEPKSLTSWDNPALVSSACYWLPNRGLVLRLINTTDRELSTAFTVGFKHHSIHETNMLEEIQRTLADDTVTLGPRGVKTLLFALPPQTGV